MATHIGIQKKDRENNMSLLRRFRRAVNGWGGTRKVRSERYHSRNRSDFWKKQQRLRALNKKAEKDRLYKLGEID